MLKKIAKHVLSFFILLFLFFSISFPVKAQFDKPLTYGLSDACMDKGDCEVEEFITIAVNVVNLILGFIGSLTFFFFIYGGVMYIISAGASEKVTKATGIIQGATTGLILVFSSFMIINFVLEAFGVKSSNLRILFK